MLPWSTSFAPFCLTQPLNARQKQRLTPLLLPYVPCLSHPFIQFTNLPSQTGATAAPPPPPPPPPAALVVNPGEAGSLADGQAALAQNPLFKTLTHDSDCFDFDAQSCVTNSPASCFEFKFTLSPPCPGDQICAALPFANGTSVSCTTQAEVDALIAATGAK
ncbi:hypothetical protein B0H10DRAFT_2225575 [Mycena sp. CBHHK59/15]|nr:hypothetical protein B0H10DRAFT_2225575 [Mycena sp. CBHHK59/15]